MKSIFESDHSFTKTQKSRELKSRKITSKNVYGILNLYTELEPCS